MKTDTPTHRLVFHWPIIRNEHLTRLAVKITCCSISDFSGKRVNHSRSVFVFGWCLATWERAEWTATPSSDYERAEKVTRRCIELERELGNTRLRLAMHRIDSESVQRLNQAFGLKLEDESN